MTTKTIQIKEERDRLIDQIIVDNDYEGIRDQDGWETLTFTVQDAHPYCYDAILVRLAFLDSSGTKALDKVPLLTPNKAKPVYVIGKVEFIYKFDEDELIGIVGPQQLEVLGDIADHLASHIDINSLGGLQRNDQGYIKIVPINFIDFDEMMEMLSDYYSSNSVIETLVLDQ